MEKKVLKNTPLGLLPKEWEIKKIGEMNFDISDGNYSSRYPKSSDFRNKGVPFIRANNIKNMKVIDDDMRFISESLHAELLSGHLKKDDILITTRGDIGNIAFVPNKHIESNINAQIVRINTNCVVNHIFLGYFLSHSSIQKLIKGAETGSALKQLPKGRLYKLPVAVPPLPEQIAIAKVLSDVDAMIEAQEALIEKKRLIKQGGIQELLTGKRRLPGFSGEWKEASLEELGEISSAGVDKKIRKDEIPVRLLNYMDVYSKDFVTSKDLKQKVTAPIQKAHKCSVQKGDVFFTPSSETPNDIANSAVSLEDIKDGTYSYHIVRFRLSESKKWDLLFCSYIFKTKFFLDQAEKICAGSGQRYVINLSGFQKLRIKFPEDKKEQQGISEIIFNIDNEIDLLNKRLEKFVLIKQGMMQELLTGRTRLV